MLGSDKTSFIEEKHCPVSCVFKHVGLKLSAATDQPNFKFLILLYYLSSEQQRQTGWMCSPIITFFVQLRHVLMTWLYMGLVVRKPVFGVSDQVPHKPGCTDIDDERLEISDSGSRGIVLSM